MFCFIASKIDRISAFGVGRCSSKAPVKTPCCACPSWADCLKDLNTAELALVSPNRILTNAIVLFCDHHEGIYGWHSMFENDVQTNVSNVQYLIDAGLQGSFYCVLCGPWTNVHIEKVRTTYSVRPEKVITAFRWLKDNNIHFKDFVIPSPDMLPSPRVIQHSKTL